MIEQAAGTPPICKRVGIFDELAQSSSMSEGGGRPFLFDRIIFTIAKLRLPSLFTTLYKHEIIKYINLYPVTKIGAPSARQQNAI